MNQGAVIRQLPGVCHSTHCQSLCRTFWKWPLSNGYLPVWMISTLRPALFNIETCKIFTTRNKGTWSTIYKQKRATCPAKYQHCRPRPPRSVNKQQILGAYEPWRVHSSRVHTWESKPFRIRFHINIHSLDC